VERGILQLEGLTSRSACIDPHFLISLWEACLYPREHFVAAHTCLHWSHLRIIPDLLILMYLIYDSIIKVRFMLVFLYLECVG
jgi:hypothetical protein